MFGVSTILAGREDAGHREITLAVEHLQTQIRDAAHVIVQHGRERGLFRQVGARQGHCNVATIREALGGGLWRQAVELDIDLFCSNQQWLRAQTRCIKSIDSASCNEPPRSGGSSLCTEALGAALAEYGPRTKPKGWI